MSLNDEIDFNMIVSDIIKKDRFMRLQNEVHHGTNRLAHSLRVAKTTYKWSKKLKLQNYEEVTRAALLHDYFLDSELSGHVEIFYHPQLALQNAINDYKINYIQKDIITSHMFPVGNKIPKYKESWLVSLADKYCSLQEFAKYKISFTTGTLAIYIINLLMFQ